MLVDEKTDVREIARDGGTVPNYRACDFIFREGGTAGFMYLCSKDRSICRRGTKSS
jgi:hypothetical protein